MHIAVIGAGAVGGLVGALLHRSGERVSFVARGAALDRLRTSGVQVKSPLGDFETGPLAASESPAALGVADLVLVAVKAWQVPALAPSLAPLVGPHTVVVPAQNGVLAPEQLAAALGSAAVGGVCHVLASLEAPAQVVHRGPRPKLTLGELHGGTSARLEALVPGLQRAGLEVALDDDVVAALWEKLLFVEPYGSVGAATRSPVDVVRAVPETRALLRAAMEEVAAVAAARGTPARPGSVDKAMARIDLLPAGATASLHRDVVEGRPSELDDQTGLVVRLARELSVPAPVHGALWALLLPQTLKASARR